jgi:NADPH:quinone reductase-like Zn-dependent oxidoreductase
MKLEADTTEIGPVMRAVRLHTAGGPAGLILEEVETPGVLDGEALVRVHAAAITRDELGWPTDRLPAIPSYEMSGEVVAVGPGVETVALGDPVFALTPFDRDGAAADYVAVPATVLAGAPRSIDHIGAAALPLAALSAWQGLFDHGHLEQGQRVLVTGVSGGVGHLATQLARAHGALVIGSTSASEEGARAWGVDQVIDGAGAGLEDLEPVDLVFDTAGGDLLPRSPAVVRDGGRIVSVAEDPPEVADGRSIETVYFVVEPNREQLLGIARLVDAGVLRPEIDSVFPLADARAAFERSEQRGKRGKVVLRVSEAGAR